MRTLTTQAERAAMVPAEVRRLLTLLGDARVAGGAVRDSLLGVEPKDWDVATSLLPMVVMDKAHAAGLSTVPTGLQHGTVTVMVGKMPVEVTTLRVDVDTDGRHAEVEFTTDWKTDASRRDLTMNSMFMHADGSVDDFFGGQDDLLEGMVRFVGNPAERIQEDFLRILRFFRFAGRMSVTKFDGDAMRAILHNSPNLHKISGERVWMEMSKILTGNLVADVLDRMVNTNVLSSVGVLNPNVHGAFSASGMGGTAPTVLAALLDNPEVARKVADAWKLSRKERETLMYVSEALEFLTVTRNMTLLDWKKRAVMDGKDLVLEAMTVTDKMGWRDELVEWDVPVFPLTGANLMAAGHKPGPEMGRKLKAAKQAWLDADFQLDMRKLVQLAATL